MSLYVLDTDVLTLFEKGDPVVIRNVIAHTADGLAITVISVEEQLSGWYAQVRRVKRRDLLAQAYQRLATNVEFLADMLILPFPEPAIVRYENLKTLGLNVRKMDLRIAAVTLEHGGILVTRNLRDFQRIPNLIVENWAV
jgi:tRNA(fMet)-specific endonuclease VapC